MSVTNMCEVPNCPSCGGETGHGQAITETDLDEIDRLDREATPEPWEDIAVSTMDGQTWSLAIMLSQDVWQDATPEDQNCAARARTLLPRLAAEVRAHRARPTSILCAPGITEIGRLLRTQDNRASDAPIFIVEEKRRFYGLDPAYAGEIVWIDAEGDEAAPEKHASLEAAWDEDGEEPEDWNRTAYKDEWHFVTACLTEKGCQDYIARNGHNHRGELRTYAAGSYRNEEWRSVRSFLLSLGEQKPAASPILCVTGLVVDGDKLALIRSRKPGRAWELPGGKLTPEDSGDWRVALSREIREETGQQIEPAAWTVTDVLIGKPAPGAEFASTIIVARAAGRGALTAGDDAADAGWFKRDELPSDLSKLESLKALQAWATGTLPEERIQGMGRLAESRLVCIEELAVISADQTRRLKVITESAEKVASQNAVMLAAMERSTDPNMRALAEKIRRTT